MVVKVVERNIILVEWQREKMVKKKQCAILIILLRHK